MEQKEWLICRGKKCVVNHLKKHHKIYTWTGIGMTIMAIVAGIFISTLWTSVIRTNASWNEWETALMMFYRIEDIATRRDLLFHKIGKEHFLIWEYNFHDLQDKFHLATSIGEKFKIARQLDELVHWQDEYARAQNIISSTDEAKFQLLEANFDLQYNIQPILSRTDKSDTFKNNASTIFSTLESIATKRDDIIHILWKKDFLIWEDFYHKYAEKLKTASSIEEKYILIKSISNILQRQDNYFRKMEYIGQDKYITDEEENIYVQTQYKFDKIRQWELFNILEIVHKS